MLPPDTFSIQSLILPWKMCADNKTEDHTFLKPRGQKQVCNMAFYSLLFKTISPEMANFYEQKLKYDFAPIPTFFYISCKLFSRLGQLSAALCKYILELQKQHMTTN